MNLSSDQSCQSTCGDYVTTKSYACNDGTYCQKMDQSTTNRSVTCDGTIRNCKFIEGNMEVCAASVYFDGYGGNIIFIIYTFFQGDLIKTMRYTTITFESGKKIGSEVCSHPTQVIKSKIYE